MPLLTRSDLTDQELRHLHLEGVSRVIDRDGYHTVVARSLGYAAFVSGTGPTVEDAQHAAYALAKKLVIPKVMYRTDIGDRYLLGDRDLLREFGWI